MSLLPIHQIESDFHRDIANHHLVVEADTGSGKSTCLPIWASQHGRVLVVEPRRIACTSLAGYLAQQSGQPLGKAVGYAIKLEAHYTPETEVVFVTPGVALRWLAEDGLKAFDIVMIDEFHERRWDIDLLTALLKRRQSHRLVVTSATLEGDKLSQYLSAKRLISQGRLFEVDTLYQCKDSRDLPRTRDIESYVAQAVKQELARPDSCKGDILVFLPGRKEITQCAQILQSLTDILVVKLHASVSEQERDRALNPQAKRKVVLATNVAETSLTIPNITCVIDSGLERRTLQRNGRTTLSLKSISQASAKQRAGRAGRVMAGRCIRLYGQHAALEPVTPPELQREDLVEPMLAAACNGSKLQDLTFLDPLPEKTLAQAEQQLRQMNAIDEQGLATPHGKLLYPLPIDALFADLLTRMPTRALKEAMADVAAALSVPAALYQLPRGEQLEALNLSEPLGCDMSLLVSVVRGQHCASLTLEPQAVSEARGLAAQLRSAFELPCLEASSRYDQVKLGEAIAHCRPELIFVRREKRREAFANGYLEVLLGRNSRLHDKTEAMLVLDTHSLPGRGVKQTLTLATVTAPISLKILEELSVMEGAAFGEWVQGESVIEAGQAQTKVDLVYAGRVVASRWQQAEGKLALKPIVEQVLSGELLPNLAAQRSAEIRHWQLYNQLGYGEKNTKIAEVVDFETWFTQQLEALGITELEEMELFSVDDFPFEGIPEWEYPDFAEKFPLNLELADLKLNVEYFTAKKLVQVIYHQGGRKGDPKRWELPSWKGWRIQYKKASRIIDVR